MNFPPFPWSGLPVSFREGTCDMEFRSGRSRSLPLVTGLGISGSLHLSILCPFPGGVTSCPPSPSPKPTPLTQFNEGGRSVSDIPAARDSPESPESPWLRI